MVPRKEIEKRGKERERERNLKSERQKEVLFEPNLIFVSIVGNIANSRSNCTQIQE